MRNVLILHQFALKEISSSKKKKKHLQVASNAFPMNNFQLKSQSPASTSGPPKHEVWRHTSVKTCRGNPGCSGFSWIFKQQNWGFANDAVLGCWSWQAHAVLTRTICHHQEHTIHSDHLSPHLSQQLVLLSALFFDWWGRQQRVSAHGAVWGRKHETSSANMGMARWSPKSSCFSFPKRDLFLVMPLGKRKLTPSLGAIASPLEKPQNGDQ